jgi:recombination protein RecT
MSQQVAQKQQTPQATLNHYFTQHKNQLAAALPKHLNPDRMVRLALTAFSQNKALQACDPKTVFSSIIVLSQLGLEPGIDGQGYLVPYKGTCTPIPGWKGYVDLVSRAGRATVWTGAVFEGDDFDYQLGDTPYLKHRPGDENDENKLTHVYAIGRVKGAEFPVIEVWTIGKIIKHRDKYNKVGKGHYSYNNLEMYARKIPLLQVLKYMPKSVELQNAMEVDLAATQGKTTDFINGDFVTLDAEPEAGNGTVDTETGEECVPQCSDEQFKAFLAEWTPAIQAGKRTFEQAVAAIERECWLTQAQKNTLKGIK